MRYTALPTTGFTPSVLCLGTGGFGTRIPQDQAFQMLDRFAELGGNFLDTARVYAAWLPGGEGASERTIGAWLKSRDMAASCIVATKGAHPNLATMRISRLTPAEIAADVSASLEALGVEAIDLYWLHRDDPGHSGRRNHGCDARTGCGGAAAGHRRIELDTGADRSR